MFIPDYAKINFQIQPGDDKYTVMLKTFYLNHDRISRDLMEKREEQRRDAKHKKQVKEIEEATRAFEKLFQ